MCAIVDTNVVHEVFSSSPCPAGEKFFEWVEKGRSGRLVAGGKLLVELDNRSDYFRKWRKEAQFSGMFRTENDQKVNDRAEQLKNEGLCQSNDAHVIALAQLSGARLLYTNDEKLQKDFRNKNLVDNPGGKVYSTKAEKNPNKEFRSTHRRLLGRNDLCRVG